MAEVGPCRGLPNPTPSRSWGSAPDPAPQTPEGLSLARPAIEDEARSADTGSGAEPQFREGAGWGKAPQGPHPRYNTNDSNNTNPSATTEMIVSITDHVLTVCPTSSPKYSFTSQNPASLT